MPMKATKLLTVAAAMGALLAPVAQAESGLDITGDMAVAVMKYDAHTATDYIYPDTVWMGGVKFTGFSDVMTPMGPMKATAVIDVDANVATHGLKAKEAYMTIGSPKHGKLTLGFDEGVADRLYEVDHPVLGPSDWLIQHGSGTATQYLEVAESSDFTVADDHATIKYTAPAFNGVVFGVSHTKCQNSGINNAWEAGSTSTGQASCGYGKNFNELAVTYGFKTPAKVDVDVSAGITFSDGVGQGKSATSYGGGFNATYDKFKLAVGLGLIEDNQLDSDQKQAEQKIANFSLRYNISETLAAGVGYYTTESDANDGTYSDRDTKGLEFAVTKAMSDKFVTGLAYQKAKYKNNSGSSKKDVAFLYLAMDF